MRGSPGKWEMPIPISSLAFLYSAAYKYIRVYLKQRKEYSAASSKPLLQHIASCPRTLRSSPTKEKSDWVFCLNPYSNCSNALWFESLRMRAARCFIPLAKDLTVTEDERKISLPWLFLRQVYTNAQFVVELNPVCACWSFTFERLW